MFKRIFSITISFLMLFSAISAEELSDADFPIYEDITFDGDCTFLIELEGGGVLERRQNGSMPLSDYEKSRSYTELEALQASALKSVSKVTETTPKGQLTHIMNGIIVDGSTADLQQLKGLPNVKAVHVLPKLYTIEPVSSTPIIETNSEIADLDKLQTEPIKLDSVKNQYTGDGMVIGIIDSELWYDHAVFQTEPQNPKLSLDDIAALLTTQDFKAEEQLNTLTADDVYISSKIPFAFDYANNDCDPKSDNENRYHGTHVAGIAAASSEDYSGIAKDAQIVFAKVAFDDAAKGSIDIASTLLALDDMVMLDVDVINMSLGISAGFSDGGGIFNNIFKALENSGICVVASAGNEGSFGNDLKTTAPLASAPDYGLIGQPASCVYSTAVASCASSVFLHEFILSDGTTVKYQDSSFQYRDTSFDTLMDNRTVPYVYCGMGTESDFESIEDLTNSVAIISRGGATFSDSIGRAEDRGAIAAVIINNTDDYFFIDSPDFGIPAIVVSSDDSYSITNAASKELTVNKKSNLLSSFSSRGATPDLKLKPEVTSVGACVYSAAYKNSFAIMDGTSQAAPQYAGSCAVVLDHIETSVNPDMSKAASHILASQILASSAVPWTIDGKPDSVPTSPRIQGAGVINLEAATTSPSVLYNTYNGKTKVELGQLSGNTFSFDFTVQNFSDHNITYNLSADVITDDYKTTIIDGQPVNIVDGSRYLETAQVTFDCKSSITVEAHHEEVITATITVSDNELSSLKEVFENGLFIEGYIRLTSDALPEISIPFMGFHGDWCHLPALANASYGLSNSFYVASGSYISPLTNDNGVRHFSPNLGVFLARIQNIRNLSQLVLMIQDENDEIVYGEGYTYVPKMYKANKRADFDTFTGINTFTNKALPDGKYTVTISAVPVCPEGHIHNQLLTFDIYIDRTVPHMLNAYISNDTIDNINSLWLKVSASDSPETALKQYTLIDPTQNEVPYRYLPDTNEYAFNIRGYSLPSCKIKLTDAAQNTAIYDITRANGYAKSFQDGICTDIESFNALLSNGLILNRFNHLANTDGTQKRLYAFDKNLNPLTEPYDVTEN